MPGLRRLPTTLLVLLLSTAGGKSQQAPLAQPAVPVEPKSAILAAFTSHSVVALGDAHGNLQGDAFRLALIRDPRFATVVNDVVVESGNSKYQPLVDRFVRGEDVPQEELRRAWLDTTQQHIASLEVPALIGTIRDINASLTPERRLRVLLAEPPIDWESIRTSEDLKKWEAEPMSSRDVFGAELIRREVLAKNRRALALYGAGHFLRKVVSRSIVTLLEEGNRPKVFTIWTNAAADMAAMQPDVAKWPVPSLTLVKGTALGATQFSEYFGPSGTDIPPQWRAPMQDQFDAVLYLGPTTAITLARPTPWRCSEPAMPERLRRVGLMAPRLVERVKKECIPD